MVRSAFFIVAVIACGCYKPTILLTFVFGLLPTFFCLLMLKSELLALCVGIFNLCGVLPFIIKAIGAENIPIEHIFFYLFTFENLSIMYVPAAVGFVFAKFVSKLIVKVIVKHYEKKRDDLKKELLKLVETWGEDIKK